jgi:hypothetical protein
MVLTPLELKQQGLSASALLQTEEGAVIEWKKVSKRHAKCCLAGKIDLSIYKNLRILRSEGITRAQEWL